MIKQQVEQFKNVTMPSDWSSNYKTYIDQNYVAVQVIKSTYNVKNYEENPGKLRTSVFLIEMLIYLCIMLFSILGTTTDQLISDLGGQVVL